MVSSPTVRPIPMVTRAHFTGKPGVGAAMLRNRDELTGKFLAFQTKYRELREQFLELRQSYFLIECAWCKQRIRWKPKMSPSPSDTSHGICLHCAADVLSPVRTAT